MFASGREVTQFTHMLQGVIGVCPKTRCGGQLVQFSTASGAHLPKRTLRSGSRKPYHLTHRSEFWARP